MYDVTLKSVSTFEKPFHFLQTEFWASFKKLHGWTPFFFEASSKLNDKAINFSLTVLVRRLNRFVSIAYIPLGIELSADDAKLVPYNSIEYAFLLQDVSEALKRALPKNVFCIRFDPPIEFSTNEDRAGYLSMYKKSYKQKLALKKSLTDVQPPDTVLLPLDKSEEELLSAMKPKWRYNIRLAEKKGVTIKTFGADGIDDFYSVFMETASRDKIAVHDKEYYKSLLELSSQGRKIKTTLYIAEHEGEVLAGIITLFTETEAVYLYGASSDRKRNLMPAYLLQWTAIKDAKEFGSKVYDFYGIPPTDDEHHPMHGLYRFKTGFGGDIIHRAGSIDMPIKPATYGLYIFLEKMRAFYFRKVRKLLKRH